jgi:hypothetical protein
VQIVEIVADRFAVTSDRCAVDLATSAFVVLKMGMSGGVGEQARWLGRCDWLYRIRHSKLAVLLDYGAVGESKRFEAWQCGLPWRGAAKEAARASAAVQQFLRACGRTSGDHDAPLFEYNGRLNL